MLEADADDDELPDEDEEDDAEFDAAVLFAAGAGAAATTMTGAGAAAAAGAAAGAAGVITMLFCAAAVATSLELAPPLFVDIVWLTVLTLNVTVLSVSDPSALALPVAFENLLDATEITPLVVLFAVGVNVAV